MATAKLTGIIRKDILNNLVLKAFDEEHKALKAEENLLAIAAWEASFKPEHLKLIKQCPPLWFSRTRTIKGRFGYQHINLTTENEVPLPDSKTYATIVSLEENHELAAKVLAWKKRWDDFEARRDKAKRMAQATLDSVTTVGRLIEVWPEVKPFIPEMAKAGLPMVPVKALNEAFKLP